MKQKKLSSDEDVAKQIANLKGKALEEYIRDAEAVLELVSKRLEEPQHSPKMRQAYQETKQTLEAILEIVQSNRSN